MTSDLPEGAGLPHDTPYAKSQNLRSFVKLFGAWVAMRSRSGKTPETEAPNV